MNKLKTTILLIAFGSVLNACQNTKETPTTNKTQDVEIEATKAIVLLSEVDWEKLNPARGDQSPQAGTLWGDRKSTVATGFLAKFVDGFSSPPHIHNVSYRAIVIKGHIHNDDDDAKDMWMPPGSFWTQPAGEAHITAAKGDVNIAYVEIDNGPYLVKPINQAFDNGERPINIDKSNIVWLDASNTSWINESTNAEVSFIYGNPKEGHLYRNLIKLPAGFTGKIITKGSSFRAVVIEGLPNYKVNKTETKTIEPGSYFSSEGGASVHEVTSKEDQESIIYIRTNGKYIITSNKK